jgi:hypothetical protein
VLVELAIILASCDVAGSAASACKSQCPRSTGASYTICAEKGKSTSSVKPGVPKRDTQQRPKPRRLCSYYANGTIDVPTSSIITAWVDVGSRACIGDPKPEPRVAAPTTKTVAELTTEAFTAHATSPFAYLRPSGEVEITQLVNFGVNRGGGEHAGELFGSPATIRFVAVYISWSFSDGQRLNGEFVSTSFLEPGQVTGLASVDYRIDYRRLGGTWVLGAAYASLSSNQLSLSVIDPPRRTLLVG